MDEPTNGKRPHLSPVSDFAKLILPHEELWSPTRTDASILAANRKSSVESR